MSSGLYYFVPRLCGASVLAELGLEHAFATTPAVSEVDDTLGPEGRCGTILHDYPAPNLPRPIEWYAGPGQRYWIGWHKFSKPGAEQLFNGIELRGAGAIRVKLADGGWWNVPRVAVCTTRDPQRVSGLPSVLAGDVEDPQLTADPRYGGLQRRCAELAERFEGAGGFRLEHRETVELCGELLGVCYRVRGPELLALELLSLDTAAIIFHDALDAMERMRVRDPAVAEEFERIERQGGEVQSWATVIAMRRALGELQDA